MFEEGLYDEPVKSIAGERDCVMCGFTCFGEIALRKHVNTKIGDIFQDKIKNEENEKKDTETNDLEDCVLHLQ